jgi:UDP-glucose 4-epimerase
MTTAVNIAQADWRGQAVLVTGGAGFIGSHLVEELTGRGAQVTIVDDLSHGRLENLASVADAVDFHRLDLACDDVRPLLSAREFSMIFHLAGSANVPVSVEDPRADLRMNPVATLELLEALRDASPRSPLVFVSTAMVYGEGDGTPLTELDRIAPVSPYGVSKLCAEHYVSIYPRLFGLRTVALRLFSLYGPRLRRQVVYDLIRKVHDNPDELFMFGDGTQQRDFNHVANAVAAMLLVAERADFRGEHLNVAGEEAVTIQRLAELICEQMGASPKFVYSGDVRPGDINRWTADTTALRRLGYRPRVRLAEGLADTVRWYLDDAAKRSPAQQASSPR